MHEKLIARSRRHIAALAAAFGLAAGAPAFALGNGPDQPAPDTGAGPTLWKTESFDAVVSLQTCPKNGVCGNIYWLNPQDTRLYDYFGDKEARPAAFPGEATPLPTAADVQALCGFSPDMEMSPQPDDKNHWAGTMEMRGMNMRVNVDARIKDEDHLDIRFSKAIFSHNETWTRVKKDDPRYPPCRPAP